MEIVIRSKSSTSTFPLSETGEWRIGRHPDNDITIDDPGASRHHARLKAEKGIFYIEDLGTGNGTTISGVSIPPNSPVEVKEDETIEIGDVKLRLSDSVTSGVGVITPENGTSDPVYIEAEEPVLIGRLPVCQISIDDPGSSRINSEIVREDSRFYIRDLGSSNGTFLNDKKIKREVIKAGDIIRIGEHSFTFSIVPKNEVPAKPKPAPANEDKPDREKATLPAGCNTLSISLITALLSGLAVFLYMANGDKSGSDPTADTSGNSGNTIAPVVIEKPLIRDIPVTLEKTGNVLLSRQDTIPFPVGQKVAEVHVKNGQRVKEKDPLVTFETTDELRSAKKQASAALNQANEDVGKAKTEVAKAEAGLENAKRNLSIIKNTHDRSLPAWNNGDLLRREWDEILVKLAEAEAGVKIREAEKEQAQRSVVQAEEAVVQVQTDLNDVEKMIRDLTIEAGSDGVVNRLELKKGYTVTPINNSMDIIEYEDEVKVTASVSEDDITVIREGMEAEVSLPRAEDEVYKGKVTYIPPTASNRNYDVEITVANKDMHFRPGQQVSVRFIADTKENATLVPASALDSAAGTGYFIYSVEPDTSIAKLIPVRRGQEVRIEGRNYIEITPADSGKPLPENTQIITRGNKAVNDGMKVVTLNPDESR